MTEKLVHKTMEPPATCIARQYRNQNYRQGESGTWKTDEVGEAAYGQTSHETGYAGPNATDTTEENKEGRHKGIVRF